MKYVNEYIEDISLKYDIPYGKVYDKVYYLTGRLFAKDVYKHRGQFKTREKYEYKAVTIIDRYYRRFA